MSFSKRLRLLRLEKNLRQDELAKILNISRQSISNYENSARFPNDELLLYKMAKFFDVSLDYLFGFTNLRKTHLYEMENIKIKENIATYSLDKKEALEELFRVVDNLSSDEIVKITKAIKLFNNDSV